MGNLIDHLDPKLYTGKSLEELRASQERFEANHKTQDLELDPEYIKKVHAKFQPIMEPTLPNIKTIFLRYIRLYEQDSKITWSFDFVKDQYRQICEYLHELIHGNTEKGILLIGISGAGKTTIMKRFLLPTFRAFSGGNFISVISSSEMVSRKSELIGIIHKQVVIDDLGMELNYTRSTGTWVVQKPEIAEDVYYILEKRMTAGLITHVTTNILESDLPKIYGRRSEWRFEKMFHPIQF